MKAYHFYLCTNLYIKKHRLITNLHKIKMKIERFCRIEQLRSALRKKNASKTSAIVLRIIYTCILDIENTHELHRL